MVKEKYLVVLGGSPRGGEKAWNSMYKYVKDHLNADLAICTGKKWLNNQSFIEKADYDWTFEEANDWSEYYSKNYDKQWLQAFELGRNTGLLESGFIHFAIKDIILENHIEEVEKYDYIIYSRFDQMYINYHLHGYDQNILIPEGEDYFGIGDRHILIPSMLAKDYFGILKFFLKNYNEFKHINYLNCETVNKLHLESFVRKESIFRTKRIQFTVAEKNDQTNWRKAKFKIYLLRNIKLKYPDEFLKALENLAITLNTSKINFINITMLINYYYLLLRRSLGSLKS
tara:strand:- start:1906 stop:2763 length:858 start_codon:yes stop_codon:yes gene_type:complete